MLDLPGSKSVSNRALLLAALAPGFSRLRGGLEAEDTRWMREGLTRLGIRVHAAGDTWDVDGGTTPRAAGPLWLGASGTSLRFLLPWLALCAEGPVDLQGEPRLFERPLAPLVAPLAPLGSAWSPAAAGGRLTPVPTRPTRVDLQVDARLSSQFLTGLALALSALPEGGTLHWDATPSASYLELTAHWMARFGCDTELGPRSWRIPGGVLRPVDLTLPGDWSGAAAFLAAAAITGRNLRLGPLDPGDPQGDRALVGILQRAGCRIQWMDAATLDVAGPLQRGVEADLSLCPDLGPVLSALAALAPGPSVLTGLETLPLKECDRLDAAAELVRWLGGTAEVDGDHTLRIAPGQPTAGRRPFDPRNDHRMAFAAAVGGLRAGGFLRNPGCVAKTFPAFWSTWHRMLGLDGP